MPKKGGAKKAYAAMKRTYGAKKGKQVYYATANKRGKGKTQAARERNAFKKKR